MSRTAVVTGLNSGLGKATGQRLRRDGWKVIGLDLTASDDCLQADVSDDASVGRAAATLNGPA